MVAYDVEWHGEILTHRQNALFVPYRDTAQMARGICELITDHGLARSLGRHGRETMLAQMDPESLIQQERAVAERLFTLDPSVRK